MKTVLAPNAPWPGREPAPKPAPKKVGPPRKPRGPYRKKINLNPVRLMKVTFNEAGEVAYMEPVELCYTQRIEGCHSYKGQWSHVFNEGFRAAELIYGIGNRQQRTK